MQIETIDLEFQGAPHVIAAFLVRGPRGPVLVETGPTSTLPGLLAALRSRGVEPTEIPDVLVTHIHLDHAGSAGWWARQGSRVHVHPVGRPHLVDPSKLVTSATRIYGDRMQVLWGDVLPAAPDRVIAVEDGDELDLGGLRIRVVATPGHAWHHHAYCIGDTVFVGDAAGILLPGKRWIDLPAPPPEFDLPAWKSTLARLRSLEPRSLYRTHFDGTSDPVAELDTLESLLDDAVGWVEQMLAQGLDREQMVVDFTRKMRASAAVSGIDEGDAYAYELANPRVMSVDGIARYLRKSAGG